MDLQHLNILAQKTYNEEYKGQKFTIIIYEILQNDYVEFWYSFKNYGVIQLCFGISQNDKDHADDYEWQVIEEARRYYIENEIL